MLFHFKAVTSNPTAVTENKLYTLYQVFVNVLFDVTIADIYVGEVNASSIISYSEMFISYGRTFISPGGMHILTYYSL